MINKAWLECTYKRVKEEFNSEIHIFKIRSLIIYSPPFSVSNSYVSDDLSFLFFYFFLILSIYLEFYSISLFQHFCWEFHLSCHAFCFQSPVNLTVLFQNITLFLFNCFSIFSYPLGDILLYHLFLPGLYFFKLPFSFFCVLVPVFPVKGLSHMFCCSLLWAHI